MVTKMTDIAIKEMDSIYDTGITMMTYFEKQLRTLNSLHPWMKETSLACDAGKEFFKPFMAAMGMVSQAEYGILEQKAAELVKQLQTARKEMNDEIETYRRAIEVHQATIADQAEYMESLKKLNESVKTQLADLKKDLAEKKTLIADREKKIAESAKELIESKKTISTQEKELKKTKKQTDQMEKEISELKARIKSDSQTSA